MNKKSVRIMCSVSLITLFSTSLLTKDVIAAERMAQNQAESGSPSPRRAIFSVNDIDLDIPDALHSGNSAVPGVVSEKVYDGTARLPYTNAEGDPIDVSQVSLSSSNSNVIIEVDRKRHV